MQPTVEQTNARSEPPDHKASSNGRSKRTRRNSKSLLKTLDYLNYMEWDIISQRQAGSSTAPFSACLLIRHPRRNIIFRHMALLIQGRPTNDMILSFGRVLTSHVIPVGMMTEVPWVLEGLPPEYILCLYDLVLRILCQPQYCHVSHTALQVIQETALCELQIYPSLLQNAIEHSNPFSDPRCSQLVDTVTRVSTGNDRHQS